MKIAASVVVLVGCGPNPSKLDPPQPVIRVPIDARIDARIDAPIDAPIDALVAIVDPCAVRDVELVYVLTDDARLMSFDPQKLPNDPFREIGRVACGMKDPNSMAVDNTGTAWIVDHARKLVTASIFDAHCTAMGEVAGDAPSTFGMGFVSNGKRSETNTAETLFVADAVDQGKPSRLAKLDLSTKPVAYTAVAPLEATATWNPELTGTGDGTLFGYFPEEKASFVQEIDRATGKAIGKRWTIPQDGHVTSFAFAHWGGVFYVFATQNNVSRIHAIHRTTGTYELARDNLAFPILGAGVSTCAPLLERAN